MRVLVASLLLLAVAGACTTNSERDLDQFARDYFWGQRIAEPQLSARISEAQKHPLGSWENPVRVHTYDAERAYLARLRCSDGKRPRIGSTGRGGAGIYGSLINSYELHCGRVRSIIFVDADHPDYGETRAPGGFGIVSGALTGGGGTAPAQAEPPESPSGKGGADAP